MASTGSGRALEITSAINVTPMVDVMLVLLIIFMVVTPMLQPGKLVQLAKAANPTAMSDADKADSLVVAVLHDGTVFLGNERVESADLGKEIQERLATRQNKIIYVKADARVKYKYLVDVVDVVRIAGADELGLLTEPQGRLSALR